MNLEGIVDDIKERFIINIGINGQSDTETESDDCDLGGDDGGGFAHSDHETDMSGIQEIEIPFDQI